MIRIAIVDDEQLISQQLEAQVEEYFPGDKMEKEVFIFTDPVEFYSKVEQGERFEIYLLDIEMPGIGGMELADKIREKDRSGYLLFITSHVEYAVEGYERNAYRFIPKSLLAEKLPLALLNIVEELEEREDQRAYLIQNSLRCERIPFHSILYLFKQGKNVVFVTESGTSQDRTTLSEVYQVLDEESFIYIDRGYLVNIRHVMKVKNHEVYLRDGTTLYISRSHVQEVKSKISAYWKK